MALLGGGVGGAGNPVGGSFTGPAEALEVIGDHAYAYSSAAAQTAGAGEVTKLEFTSGNYYFVGHLNAANGDLSSDWWRVSFFMNGTLVIRHDTNNNAQSNNEDINPIPVIIPPYTEVKVTLQVGSDSDAPNTQFVGRIYRTKD